MRPILQRVVLPIAVVAAGTVALVYGAKYRTAPVWRQEMEEQEVEEEVVKTNKIAVPIAIIGGVSPWGVAPDQPAIQPPAAEGHPQNPDAPPKSAGEPAEATVDIPPPGMKFVTEKMTVIETVKKPVRVSKVVDEPESWLVFAVTVGGVQRREGAVWRTYGPDEAPPLLCPT